MDSEVRIDPEGAGFFSRHPWLLVVYLLVVSFTAFLLPAAIKGEAVAGLIVLQFAILAGFGVLRWDIVRVFDRLRFLFLFLIVFNAFLPGAPADPRWAIPGVGWDINLAELLAGVLMSAQIALVVLTTHVVRVIGDEKAFINGLRSLRVAPLVAYSLDTTLALISGASGGKRETGGGGRGGGGGGGGGHGRGGGQGGDRRDEGRRSNESDDVPDPPRERGVIALFRALRARDLSPFVSKIETGLTEGAERAERLGLSKHRAQDVGTISGIAAVMMAFKLVKVLPGVPVMQGAKATFFIPLYILAADRTHTRWGGTIAGGTMGFIAFLNGDGRYGIFEVLKHLVPGLVIDLLWPLFRVLPHRPWKFVLLGLIAAFARTSTEFVMILALGADNATLLVFPALRLIPNSIAGLMSALVSYPVVTHLGQQTMAEEP
jgi:hypothetical protein